MGLFSRPKKPQLNLIDTTPYEQAYSSTADKGGAGEYADVESFYTPEMQQAVLDEMTRVAQEGGARSQAGISGAAVRSGFGVGNTSREMARRSNAESDMLNQIVQGYVSNAQNIEAQRTAQAQEYAQRKYGADQTVAENKQSQELAQLGYQEKLLQQQHSADDNVTNQWGQILGSATSSIGGMMGGMKEAGANSAAPSPTYKSAPYTPSVGITGGYAASYNEYNKPKFWEI